MLDFNFEQKITATYFGKNRQTFGWEHKGRISKNNLIVFVSAGRASFEFAEKTYTVSENECLIVPNGEFYKADTNDFCEYYFFHFTGKISESIIRHTEPISAYNYLKIPLFAFPLPKTEFIWNFSDYKMDYGNDVLNIIKECEKLHFELNRKNRLFIALKLQEILLTLADNFEEEKKPVLIEEILDFIHGRYTEKISLADIANHFHISESYIARIFKKHMNMTVMKYILSLKLDYAASLLTNSSMKTAQIAEYLHFYDEFYFSKQFKNRFGKSPGAYRRKQNR